MIVRRFDRPLLAAAAACALAAVVLVLAIGRAVRIEQLLPLSADGSRPAIERPAAVEPRVPEAALVLAAEADPFRPERTWPVQNDDAQPSDADRNREAISAAVQLVGTVVLPDDGGLAMLRVGNDPARVVRVGDRISVLRLLHVEPGAATLLADDGTRLVVRVKRGST
ncbi:MAG: hypothetical protein L0271_02785 [Gemmatimonadetes bacterium]|nr:hypothetical protein [Gemmatimonadota bacterium]